MCDIQNVCSAIGCPEAESQVRGEHGKWQTHNIPQMRHPDHGGTRRPVPWLPSSCEELPVVR